MSTTRALHWVFKIGDRTLTAKFYREILGMKVLRHEEFTEGCAAACNGPYDNRWSKTMIGYGPESSHFVIELTYNYNIFEYKKGNEFLGITIKSKEALERARAADWAVEEVEGKFKVEAPGGYPFYIVNEPQPRNSDPVVEVSMASSNLGNTIGYWRDLLKAQVFSQTDNQAVVGFNKDRCKMRFVETTSPIDRGEAYGRIAFAVPGTELKVIQERMEAAKTTILTPYVKLDTPGKASVVVVILADPDGHEICFVDEEGFSELSKFDPDGEKLLDRYIAKEAKDRPDVHKKSL
uniref:Glyoxalase domain-containing protein 4 n=1 Tax=Lygus hesperus TaxID=30085 RepID=A0A0A9XJN7_LYGHE